MQRELHSLLHFSGTGSARTQGFRYNAEPFMRESGMTGLHNCHRLLKMPNGNHSLFGIDWFTGGWVVLPAIDRERGNHGLKNVSPGINT